MNVAATVPTPKITPALRTQLRAFTTAPVAQVELSHGDALSSQTYAVTLDPRDAAPLAATDAKAAALEVKRCVDNGPFRQAAAVVDAGKGAYWMLRANVTPMRYGSDSGTTAATTPMYFEADTRKNKFVQNVPGLVAIVSDKTTITFTRED